jgi:hypothetical protein
MDRAAQLLEGRVTGWCEAFVAKQAPAGIPNWGYLHTVHLRPRLWRWPPRRRYPYDWAVQGV